MTRSLLAALALAFSALAVAPAVAGDVDLRSTAGIKKFWQDNADQKGR
jgi:hypothetical protein